MSLNETEGCLEVPSTEDEPEEVWRFALDLYGKTGVADRFLELQDSCSIDVTFLIFLLYLQKRYGIAAKMNHFALLDAAVSEWRSSVVAPLRVARRALKVFQQQDGDAAIVSLRQVVKQAELDAERSELTMLSRWFSLNRHQIEADAPTAFPKDAERLIENLIAWRRADALKGSAAEKVGHAVAEIAAAINMMGDFQTTTGP